MKSDIIQRFDTAVRLALVLGASRIAERAAAYAPGRIGSSIYITDVKQVEGRYEIEIVAPSPARFVEEGTGLKAGHNEIVIPVGRAGFLHFADGGYSRKAVEQEGQEPQGFFRRSVNELADVVSEDLGVRVTAALQ